jgi:hypothetical protein
VLIFWRETAVTSADSVTSLSSVVVEPLRLIMRGCPVADAGTRRSRNSTMRCVQVAAA